MRTGFKIDVMNREIKFRAFDLKDKNGVEIYEGDILNWDYCGSTEWKDWMKDPVYKVIYQDGYFVCAVGITKNLFLHSFRFKYCEVVGNIYQNPELLT